jgi:carbon monoxide dehydrogenase subunit G
MEIDNTFNISLPPAEAWPVLMDIVRIAPCMPGAEITEVVDEKTYKGRVSVRLGPVALTFEGVAEFEAINEASRQVKVSARGADPKGRGGAEAKVSFTLDPDGDGTRVNIHTDLQLSGSIAQYGRGAGMISDLASQLVGQFANNLDAQLTAKGGDQEFVSSGSTDQANAASVEQTAVVPISGISLGLRILWNAIKRFFGGS